MLPIFYTIFFVSLVVLSWAISTSSASFIILHSSVGNPVIWTHKSNLRAILNISVLECSDSWQLVGHVSTHFRHNMQAFFSVFHLHWIPFSSSLSSYFLHFNPIISVPILYFLSFIDMSPSFTVSFICVPNFKALSPPSTLPQLPTPFPIHQLPTANPHSYLKLSPKCHCFLYLSPFASSLPRKQEFTLPSTFFLLSRFIFYRFLPSHIP